MQFQWTQSEKAVCFFINLTLQNSNSVNQNRGRTRLGAGKAEVTALKGSESLTCGIESSENEAE